MKITVKYFGTLKNEAGTEEETVEIRKPKATAGDVVALLEKRIRDLRRHIRDEEIFIAVNHEYSGLGASIKDGDEIAFFPPVAGG